MSANPDEAQQTGTTQFQNQVFLRTRSVVSRAIAGETLIVPVRGKVGDLASIYRFNGTGTLIWEQLDSPRTLGELVEAVEREYVVPRDQAEKDVQQFLSDLFSVELVEVRKQSTQLEKEAVFAAARRDTQSLSAVS